MTSKYDVRETEELRSVDWNKVFEGAKIVETAHRVVFHGVSKFDTDCEKDKPEEIIAQILGANSEKFKIAKVEPLMKRPHPHSQL
jgi:ferredoxin-fold anticodon binding domain-containing protein